MGKDEFSIKKQILWKEIRSIVKGYLVSDIREMLDMISIKKNGGCSAPIANTVFAGMDLIGQLLQQNPIEKNKSGSIRPNTKGNIKLFLKNYMAKIDYIYSIDEIGDCLIELYRHGLSHQFLPKSLITRDSKYDDSLFIIGKNIVLNSQALARHFEESANDFLEDLKNSTDEQFIKNIGDRVNEIQSINKSKHFDILSKVERHLIKHERLPGLSITV